MIAALYVEAGGSYWNLPDVDPWDQARDARLYAGPHPVVAHHLMSYLFDCDITTHPNYGYSKTGAQSYHEMRLKMDRFEDAP